MFPLDWDGYGRGGGGGGYLRCVRSAGRHALGRPERPRMPRRPSRLATILVVVAAAFLLVYGVLTRLIASAWGPGNSDELVSGGSDLIPWLVCPSGARPRRASAWRS